MRLLAGCLVRRAAPLRCHGHPLHRGVRRPIPDDAVALQLEPGSRGRALERGTPRSRDAPGPDRGLRGGAAEVPRRRSADDREPPPALAESYFEMGETEKAEGLFRSWLAADPRWGVGWIGWAGCYRSRGG